MVKVSRILKDYRDAGSVNSLLALWGFVDDVTFMTKSGAVGLVYRVRGVDDECLDHAERAAIAHRFEQALRQLDESFRVYQYVIKRPSPPMSFATHPQPLVSEALERRASYLASKADALFELELYLVVLYEGWSLRPTMAAKVAAIATSPLTGLRACLSTGATVTALGAELDRAVAHLHQKADAFTVQLADTIAPTALPKADAFRFFRRLVNYSSRKTDDVTLTHDTHLDFYVADSAIECHRDHLEIDDVAVKVMTMKEPPARTFAACMSTSVASSLPSRATCARAMWPM